MNAQEADATAIIAPSVGEGYPVQTLQFAATKSRFSSITMKHKTALAHEGLSRFEHGWKHPCMGREHAMILYCTGYWSVNKLH